MCCFRLHFSYFNMLFFSKKKTCCSLLLKKKLFVQKERKNNLSRGKIPAPIWIQNGLSLSIICLISKTEAIDSVQQELLIKNEMRIFSTVTIRKPNNTRVACRDSLYITIKLNGVFNVLWE